MRVDLDSRRTAVATAAGVDLGPLADRLAPLLEAQERLEERMQEELERLSGVSRPEAASWPRYP